MSLALKPTHATVKAYYEALHQFGQLYIDHESAVRSAFQTLLAACGKRAEPKLTLVPEYRIKRAKSSVIVDGALIDDYKLPHGYWEAKDEKDDLKKEVDRKLDKGYPTDNTIFQAPERAILYQNGTRIIDANISRPEGLVEVVNQFFVYKAPQIDEWLKAVDEFSDRVPELSQQVESLIKEERRKNPAFRNVFDDFYTLTRQAINPNLSEEAVERMLVQHLLTERIFRRIFRNDEFRTRNVVAIEIEKVIAELTKRSLNRDDFLKKLEPFYHAIERNAENATEYSAKQDFLNTVYMRFFQGYSPKEADTHGIVYTPQPIVNFMVRSVEEILQKEFGRSLGDKGVHILDPFVGTGNFVVRIMQEIKATDLQYKYENELHCNEVMLLPYYIASMNIEHAYFDRTDEYRPFPGICLVDTFELAEADQASLGFMTEENAQRVKRQKESPIFVIIGNPPYNANQQNEDDNNKNRKYRVIDRRIAETYAKDSEASNRNSLLDPYVKAIRWASDRIGDQGIVALITNRSFADAKAFDAVRKHLARDFSLIYHLNLKGDARTTGEMRRRQAGNVFDDAIRVGVGVTILVRRSAPRKTPAEIRIAEVDDYLTSQQKRLYLENADRFSATELRTATTDSRGYWQLGASNDFESLVALGDRATKGTESTAAIFEAFGGGVKTNRDAWAYNINSTALSENMRRTIDFYNDQVSRWLRTKPSPNIDDFVTYDERKISWSRDLKQDLERGRFAEFSSSKIRRSVYRPFTASNLFLDRVMNEEVYLIPQCFRRRYPRQRIAPWR